jgi:UDP-glucose 4-epimerase
VSLRFFNVYGPDQDARGAVIPAFAAAISAGLPPRLFGDGLQSRDFVHVEDVARAVLLALEASPAASGRAFNVGSGRATTMRDLASLVGTTLGRDAQPTHESERAGDLRSSRADISLAREILGFEAQIGLEDGLRRALA